jgi:diguanylate cyclase (GGDEF)-like protein/PAS domain S-box-containing protein
MNNRGTKAAPVSAVREIAELKEVARKLLASEARFRLIVEQAPEGILVYDVDLDRLIYANKKAESLFGCGPDELLRLGPSHFYAPNQPDERPVDVSFAEHNRRALQKELVYERRIRGAQGREAVCEVRLGRLPSAKGSLLRAIFVDITDRKKAESVLKQERDFSTALMMSLPGFFTLIDERSRLVRWNDNLSALTGLSDEQLKGFDAISIVVEKDREMARAKIQESFASGFAEFEFGMHAKSGDVLTIHCTGRIVTTAGRPYLLALGADVTAQREAEKLLQESEERFRTVFGSVNEGVVISDPDTGRVVEINLPGSAMLGYSQSELVGSTIEMFSSGVPPYTQHDAIGLIQEAVLNGPQTFEWHCKAKDGHLFWVEVSLRHAAIGKRFFILSILRDISERKRAVEQITRMAHYDFLTGLANRSVFVDALQQEIARSRRSAANFAVLYLDLDGFKDVNDTLGHPVGDLLLRAVAERLRQNIRETDTAARFGGDEFAVIVVGIKEPTEAAVLADKLLRAISNPFTIQGNDIRSGASVGITVFGTDSSDAETLLSHADVALYEAKSDGRGTYRFFSDAMDLEVRARVTMTAELGDGIVAGQLFLVYQPQVDVDTGRIVGIEALVRWRHPKRGVVSPGEFIPIAEKSGLVVPLGHWVLQEACRQMKEWLNSAIAPPLIGVNLSARQFKTPLELTDDITSTLARTALPPEHLELELTESVLMDASREHNDVLLRLRKAGIHIAIDDFGNGYSSLDYLSRFPVDRIKIAQKFMQDVLTKPRTGMIVRAAIRLAQELDIVVVVEGVENAAELELVRSWGARQVQGFYFSKPLSAPDMTALLRVGKVVPAHTTSVS